MEEFIEKNKKFILAAIVILAAVLIFTGLTRTDIQHDDALYAFRAVGYLDFMNAAVNQTTPIQWFNEIPLWSRLSFHDGPPLVFLIQYIFFSLFGTSLFIARLPFALAGIGSVVALYFLARDLYSEKIAFLAASILAISSYHSWASKIGYLEPIATLLIVLTLLFYVRALKAPKNFIVFGVFLGLTLLTKYTVWFILPAIFIHLVIKHRRLIFSKQLIIGAVITLIFISPVLIYNYQMYKTRGHFDVQLSVLFNQPKDDWPVIGRSVGGNDFLEFWKTIYKSYSILFFVLFLASLVYILLKYFRNFKRQNHLLLILLFIFAVMQFWMVGAPVRLLSLINPLIALIIAVAIVTIYRQFSSIIIKVKYKKIGLAIVLIVAFAFEIFYNINTNILPKSVGQPTMHFSSYRWESLGFIELENLLLKEGLISNKDKKKIKTLDDILLNSNDFNGTNVIVFQGNVNWFANMWYFARYSLYNNVVFASDAELASSIDPNEWMVFFKKSGTENILYIKAKNESIAPSNLDNPLSIEMELGFQGLGAVEYEIFNRNGELAFIVYQVELN